MADDVTISLAISPALTPAVIDALCREIVRCDEEGNSQVAHVLRSLARQIRERDDARQAALRAWFADTWPGAVQGE